MKTRILRRVKGNKSLIQNPWRQKNKRRRSGVQMTLGVSTDETEEGSTKDGSNDLGLGSPSGDGKSLLLSPQVKFLNLLLKFLLSFAVF